MPLISLGDIGQIEGANITKVEYKVDTYATLYDGANKYTGEVPVGRTWELKVWADGSKPSGGQWSQAIKVISNVKTWSNAAQNLTGAYVNRSFSVNMPAMTSAGVTISSIKYWTIDGLEDAPPE